MGLALWVECLGTLAAAASLSAVPVPGRSRGERLWLRLGGVRRGLAAGCHREDDGNGRRSCRPNGARPFWARAASTGAVSTPEKMEAVNIGGADAGRGGARGNIVRISARLPQPGQASGSG